ncbi:hypothetical protein CNR22_13035 [Sphingobacteriaceae bacterium]|nr:hypothetical protein CNR22_13035 [Sphingobacteriaceae bacterium]
MNWFKNIYNRIFFGFLLSVLVTFFYVRPLNSPWHKFIAGDGLGYYSYLPAKYIHGDPNYDFKWFNKVHNANYIYSAFDNPEQNLLVEYKGKRINKYYQGLSYIWFPFFVMAHVSAKILHYPADGFSQPYQLFIGLASLFYLFLGLLFLRKLISKLFANPLAAVCVPIAVFYGTHLFTYAISANSLSHSYSFTFITLFIYFLVSYFKDEHNRLRNFLLCMLCLVITGCIRPLNGLIIFLIPAFIPQGFFKQGLRFERIRILDGLIILLALLAIYHQLSITYIQTNSLIAYTYTDEKFYFADSKFFDALVSYHIGLFVYVPVIFISLFGIPFLPPRKRIILPLFFFFIIYLYGAWWYWPILKRALVDFYVLPGIFLGALIAAISKRKWKITLLSLIAVSLAYFQLKTYQMNSGILDEYTTYKEVYWRNFFRINKANMYLVPPSTILKEEKYLEDFEKNTFNGNVTSEKKQSGKYSLSLGPKNYICRTGEYNFPLVFSSKGCKKIRYSFKCYFEKGVKTVHAFLQFFDKDKKMILEIPFYMDEAHLLTESWDYKEFGYEITDSEGLNATTVDKIAFTIWNVDAKNEIYIDDAQVEFLLTDRSFETVK